jgi:16S rRNA (guanine966-N2)-methyltransferase
MRVIAGKFRSRPLRSLRGMDLRPTADRLRETLFTVLSAGNPAAFEGTIWLDLCAGTGAVGIEALSREASKVYFVESSSAAAGLIRQNLDSLGVAEDFEVLKDDVSRALRQLEARNITVDSIFLDPPYRMEKVYEQVLQLLSKSSLVTLETIVVAEHDKRFDPGDSFASLLRYRTLEQGDAALSFYRPARGSAPEALPARAGRSRPHRHEPTVA